MRNKRILASVATAVVSAFALAACGGGSVSTTPTTPGDTGVVAGNGAEVTEPVTITWSGWDLARPGNEFLAISEAFHASHPNITVDLVEYPNADWAVAMTADLAAGVAPDIITLRNLTDLQTWGEVGMLMDITDLANSLDPATALRDVYQIDGHVYGVPYRSDFWVLYYNADLFREAGVALPDGTWTWEDYNNAARELAANLPAGVLPAYQHNWASTVSAFAHTQTPGADLFSDDWSFLNQYYDWALQRDQENLQPTFGAVTTGSLHHNAEFGQQRVAMTYMGTWFINTMLAEDQGIDEFEWGMAPVPQFDSSTVNNPVTIGGPTGVAINASIDSNREAAAREFVAWLAGEQGAEVLASVGLMPPLLTDSVASILMSQPGMPQDELSVRALQDREIRLENPVHPDTAIAQQVLNDFHTEVMAGGTDIAAAISRAESRWASDRRH